VVRKILFLALICSVSACATQNKAPEKPCFDMRQADVMKQLYSVNGENVCLIGAAKFNHKYISLFTKDHLPGDEANLYGSSITTDMNAKEHIRSGHDFDQLLTFQGVLKMEQIYDTCDRNGCYSGSLSKTSIQPYLASEKE